MVEASHRSIHTMPAHARVWVYKSARPFSDAERAAILARGTAFTGSWAAHGAALDACVDVLHDHFVVVAVDERQAMASGCSIDRSVRFVKELERDMGIMLTDRMVVLYEADGAIRSARVHEVDALLRAGTLAADTPVYDDLVATKADMDARFRVPLKATWMARWL